MLGTSGGLITNRTISIENHQATARLKSKSPLHQPRRLLKCSAFRRKSSGPNNRLHSSHSETSEPTELWEHFDQSSSERELAQFRPNFGDPSWNVSVIERQCGAITEATIAEVNSSPPP
ncbi:MAG: hypothetical protein ACTS7I_01925 [Candidatus Hodgkinia cicadicola]